MLNTFYLMVTLGVFHVMTIIECSQGGGCDLGTALHLVYHNARS